MVEPLVKPRLLRGLQDLFGDVVQARRRVVETVREVYERYGFMPLDTPAIEYIDVLSGSAGEEVQSGIFRVAGPDGEQLGLRFDLTVPLARVVAQYPDLPLPFRRYQISPVWRADKPGPGRFREFTQFDIDSVGVPTELADVEIIAAMCDTLAALRFTLGSYRVRYSSRRILDALVPFAGIPQKSAADVYRVIDKVEKIGREKVVKELTTGYTDDSGAPIVGLGLSTAQAEKIERFLEIRDYSRAGLLSQLRDEFASVPEAKDAIRELEVISTTLASLGYLDDRVIIDLSVARGLAYYTGPVFEAVLQDAPQFGSICGGGRYDGLVMRFLGRPLPATGVSIGVDRLVAAMSHLGRLQQRKSTADVLVVSIEPHSLDTLKLTFELRNAGIRSEFYLGDQVPIGNQIKYADLNDIPIVLICGPEEKKRGVVALKEMAVGREKAAQITDRAEWREARPGQRDVPRPNIIEEIKRLISKPS